MDLMRSPRNVTAITGIRDFSPASEPDVWNVMADEVHRGAETIRFGGAFGADTEALLAADAFRRGRTRLEVVVPARLQDQPDEAIDAAEVAADAVLELGLEPGTARKPGLSPISSPAKKRAEASTFTVPIVSRVYRAL